MSKETNAISDRIERDALSILAPYGVSEVAVNYEPARRTAMLYLGLEDFSFDAQTRGFEHTQKLDELYEDEGITVHMLPLAAGDNVFDRAD